MTKGIGIGKYITSDVFTIGGYDWAIRYYPDGDCVKNKIYMNFFLDLKSKIANVKAQYAFVILQHNGVPSDMRQSSGLLTFRSTTGRSSESWGHTQFTKRTQFEASECLKDDAFTLKCTVTVVKGTKLENIGPCAITVPPSNLNQNLVKLESGKGADITFVVNKETFRAHRGVLATRSAVFNAMFFGGMKEKWADNIVINDIEIPVFKSMLHFIYSDSLPDLEGKQDLRFMAQHLLVAADRYQLERLRFMCEDILYKNLNISNAATTPIMAEQHNCSQLKAQCLKFISSVEVCKEVALNPEFQNLMKICPSVLKDTKALKLNF